METQKPQTFSYSKSPPTKNLHKETHLYKELRGKTEAHLNTGSQTQQPNITTQGTEFRVAQGKRVILPCQVSNLGESVLPAKSTILFLIIPGK